MSYLRLHLTAVCVLLLSACPALVGPDPGVASNGEACSGELPCEDGLDCLEGFCRQGGGSSSSSGGSSGGASSGGSSSGLDGGGSECSIRLECALDGRVDGRDCIEGHCAFVACTNNDPCGSRVCVNGTCADVSACTADGECTATGGICEGGRCMAPECEDDAACNAGGLPINTCNQGRCRQRCFGDQTCITAGGICENGACVPPQCAADADCNNPDLQCEVQRCVPFTACTSDAQCTQQGPGVVCQDERCRQLPACARDQDCGAGSICQAGFCRDAPSCSTGCPEGSQCVGTQCVPAPECRGNSDCVAPLLCRAGACAMPPNANVYRVVIVTPAGVCDPVLDTRSACALTVAPGDQVALTALALDAAGRLIAGSAADWLSDATTVADVTAGPSAMTVLGAAMAAGQAHITAHVGTRSGPPLTVTNLGTTASAVRVTVVDARDGQPLGGATVRVNDQVRTADGAGVVTVDGVAPPWTVTAFAAGHDYVTGVGLSGPTLEALLPLPPAEPVATAAGLRGTVDLTAAPSQGPVSFSLSGVSAPSVSGLRFATLLGDTFVTAVTLPVVGTQNVPLPGGITVSAEVPLLGQQDIKTSSFVLGTGGRRLAWTFGGKLPLAALQGLIGLGGPQGAVFALAPYMEGLTHGLQTGLALYDLPYVVDGETEFDGEPDIDHDGNTTELVPDYTAFPQVQLSVRAEQTLRTQVSGTAAPGMQVLLVAGARVPGHGFVPLGMTSAAVQMGAFSKVMKLAPRYGGLETGDYATAAFAFGDAGQESLAVTTAETLPVESDVGALLPFVSGAGFDAAGRVVTVPGQANAHLHRAVVGGATGRWHVLMAGGAGMHSVTLPPVPAGLADHAVAGVRVEAIRVTAALDAPGGQVEALADPGNQGLLRLADEVAALSRGALATQ